jgi:2-keto-4-pentenoate hydratase/2-oxohepta-3-ene-1,7-dioic acid hydratase in catechol pathway
VKDIDAKTLAPAELAKLRKLDTRKLPLVKGKPRLGACVATPSKFVAIGLNYVDHAKESGNPIPEYPVVFYKSQTCIVGPNDNVVMPPGSTHMDWEVELGFVIGRTARSVALKDALKYVAGYCLINDVSEREYQMKRSGSQWSKGKGCDTFGPIGPWLVTTDEIKDPQTLDMWLDVNGEQRQRGNTRTMIFGVAQLVADVSQYMTLLPGDVITTGTPPGVGMGMKPEPKYLKAGDVVTLGIQGLGEQRQKIVASKKAK